MKQDMTAVVNGLNLEQVKDVIALLRFVMLPENLLTTDEQRVRLAAKLELLEDRKRRLEWTDARLAAVRRLR